MCEPLGRPGLEAHPVKTIAEPGLSPCGKEALGEPEGSPGLLPREVHVCPQILPTDGVCRPEGPEQLGGSVVW